eukprot:3843204-Pyramimonas_sp.AAC.1
MPCVGATVWLSEFVFADPQWVLMRQLQRRRAPSCAVFLPLSLSDGVVLRGLFALGWWKTLLSSCVG